MAYTPEENIDNTAVAEELENSFLAYAMSVIVSRALPDVRDGLKPVHRRILYSMEDLNLGPTVSYVKSARVVGDCFVAGTLVSTPSGLVPIEDIQVGDEVLDPRGKRIRVKTTFANPPLPVVDVKFSDGRTLTVTPGQLIRVLDDDLTQKWVPAAELAGRTVLAAGGSGFTYDDTGADRDRAYVLGLATSEGWQVDRNRPADRRTAIAMADVEAINFAEAWARREGVFSGRSARVPSGGTLVMHTLRFRADDDLLEATEHLSAHKQVPSFVLRDRSLFAPYLAGFFDGDGHIRRTEFSLVSASRRCLDQLASMLTDLGVVSHLRHFRDDEVSSCWVLNVSGRFTKELAQILLPYAKVPHKVEKLRAIAADTGRRRARTHSELIPAGPIHAEFSRRHLGAGWFEAADGTKFRSRLTYNGGKAKVRYHSDRHNDLLSVPAIVDGGYLSKLQRIGSPLAEEVRDLVDNFTQRKVISVTARELPEITYDIEVDTDEHAFVANGYYVHNCIGRFHPHGDAAVYEAMVRMAQDFSMGLPLVDGHGNYGTHSDPAAAARYTEARMSHAAAVLTADIDEDTVDMRLNYDGKLLEPEVLPAGFPNLLVNGAEGIAVGMATKMPPHNLGEAVKACQHLLANPDATVEDLIKIIPAPDLPTGGLILDVAGAQEAYRTGKGAFRMRARTEIVGRDIVVTELPYQVGPEQVIARIKALKDAGKMDEVAAAVDLSDRTHGLRLVISAKRSAKGVPVNPAAVLAKLFKLTPLEESFNIHNLALVDNQPATLTLLDMVRHYVDHRLEVTRRRCEFRKKKAEDRAHLLEGYLIALEHIDAIVALIRSSRDTDSARKKLMKNYKLDEVQATSILEMPLRRLTNLEVKKITDELAELRKRIAELTKYLSDDGEMRKLVSKELEENSAKFTVPRRSTITKIDSATEEPAEENLEIPDVPVRIVLSTTGKIGRFDQQPFKGRAGKDDVVACSWDGSVRQTVGVVTNFGRLLHLHPIDVPVAEGRAKGTKVEEIVIDLAKDEKIVAFASVGEKAPMLALVTRTGVVKRIAGKDLPKKHGQELIGLKGDDTLVGAWPLPGVDGDEADAADLVLVTSTAQLLRFNASTVRPQGRTGGGVAGMKVGDGHVVGAGVVPHSAEPGDFRVVTVTDAGSVKWTPAGDYPVKGRAGGGVRCMKMLRGDTEIVSAVIAEAGLVTGVGSAGGPAKLPANAAKRDAAGERPSPAVAAAGLLRP